MARWTEAVRYQVFDLTAPERALFVAPGFYWTVPLDGEQSQEGLPEDHSIALVGPFATHDEARDDALRWIDEVFTAAANDDTPDRKAA